MSLAKIFLKSLRKIMKFLGECIG